jgi:transposase
MFLQEHKRKKGNKIYKTIYLVESFRQNGKVKKRYLANFSHCPDTILMAIKNELKHPGSVSVSNSDSVHFKQGKSFAGLFVVQQICKRLGIHMALGRDIRQSCLALFQIAARILCQRSRLYSATEWAPLMAVEEVLHLFAFNEDTLYANLDWLSENQEKIEKKLFRFRHTSTQAKTIYLYDVTSSYFEGKQNELAAYGYNRDGKKGKMQIVVGLLCDEDGYPISVQVFKGNTQDPETISDQLQKLKSNFGIEHVVMVGDRGMIKSTSIDEINALKWHYITAITKPQIELLIKKDIIQLSLFDEKLMEVKQDDDIRYILRRNPARAAEIAKTRDEKIEKIKILVQHKNSYLETHKKASVQVALKNIHAKAKQLKISEPLEITGSQRIINIVILTDKLNEMAQLDGCYVLKSNVPKSVSDKTKLHDRYKDLAMVEHAFRTMKQSFEEMQPVYVRKGKRTKGHVMVCMLSYMVIKYIWNQCHDLGITQAAIFENLSNVHYLQYHIKNTIIKRLPDTLNEIQTKILRRLKITLPTYL